MIGIPDETFGEKVCAAIKLKDKQTSTFEEMITFLKQYVANYKLPTEVVFVNEFPVTASGKIQKVRLKDQILGDSF